jgi:hypothetical protein
MSLHQEAIKFNAEVGAAGVAFTATSAAFTLRLGGLYQVSWACVTWNSATSTLEQLGPDGTTYLTVSTAQSANGGQSLYLAPGIYKFLVTGTPTTDISAVLTRISVQ